MKLVLPDRTVDLVDGRVTGAREVYLAPRELTLLRYLSDRAGCDVTRDELLQEAYGYAPGTMSRAVDKAMSTLRAKLEVDRSRPSLLLTTQDGYRFRSPPEVPRSAAWANGFVGRTDELSLVREGVSRPGVCTIVGPPGSGKSRLAAQVASEGRRSVVACDLDAGAADVVKALADALHGSPTAEAVGVALAEREQVLVKVDGWWDPSSWRHVHAWRRQAPRATFLVTGRRCLGLSDERLLRLTPLTLRDGLDLLVLRARERGVTLSPDDGHLADLVQAVDALPLALELAACRLDLLQPEALVTRVRRGPDILTFPRPDVPRRHASLAASFDDAMAHLDGSLRGALQTLAEVGDSFDVALAEARLATRGDGMRLLHELLDRGMLYRTSGRLTMMATLRRHLHRAGGSVVPLRVTSSAG